MTITVEFWHLVGLLLGFLGVCATGLAFLFRQTMVHLDRRFETLETARKASEEKHAKRMDDSESRLAGRMDALEAVNRDETLQWQRVEREFLKFQADLPMRYVMRDDYIRGQTVVEAKLDALAVKVDNAQLRTILKGELSS